MFNSDDPSRKIKQNLAKIIAAYGIKQLCFEQSELELQKEFGPALTLDTINDRTKQAWARQWRPVIEAQKAEAKGPRAEIRYMESVFFKPRAPHFPPKGFKDDFKQAAYIATTYNFQPKRFDLSIWFNETLCGIAECSKDSPDPRGVVLIDVREGNPDKNHPLKGHIAKIIDKVSVNYARALGRTIVAYNAPHSDGALKLHQRMDLKADQVMVSSESSNECYIRHVI